MCDLGVVISSNLEWCQHVCSIVSKAFFLSHQILHCFSTNNVWILLKASVTYIKPLPEYNTVICSTFLKSDISIIESVQKRFTFCCNISNTSYSHDRNMLNRKLLEYRRVKFDLMFMHKTICGCVDSNFSNVFSVCHSEYNLQRHGFTIKPLRKSYTEHLNNFFTHKASQIWNCNDWLWL